MLSSTPVCVLNRSALFASNGRLPIHPPPAVGSEPVPRTRARTDCVLVAPLLDVSVPAVELEPCPRMTLSTMPATTAATTPPRTSLAQRPAIRRRARARRVEGRVDGPCLERLRLRLRRLTRRRYGTSSPASTRSARSTGPRGTSQASTGARCAIKGLRGHPTCRRGRLTSRFGRQGRRRTPAVRGRRTCRLLRVQPPAATGHSAAQLGPCLPVVDRAASAFMRGLG